MRKFIVCLAIIMCCYQNMFAQFSDRNLENASFVLKNSYKQDSYKINHVKSIIGKKQTNKGLIKTYETIVNEAAYSTMYTSFGNNGKKKNVNIYQYKNDTLLTDLCILRHGKDTFNHAQYVYDNRNRLVSSKWQMSLFFVPVREWRYDYNEKDKLIASRYLDKNGESKFKYEYDYFDNGSKKETRYYKRNKLLERLSFECDPKGEQVKKVKTSNYCKMKTVNINGSFIEVFEYKYDNGKPTKTIYYYTADTLLTKYEEYKKNGDLKNKTEYRYDKNTNLTEILYFRKDKLKKRYTYTFNQKNLFTKRDEFKGNGKLLNSYLYEYTYY